MHFLCADGGKDALFHKDDFYSYRLRLQVLDRVVSLVLSELFTVLRGQLIVNS